MKKNSSFIKFMTSGDFEERNVIKAAVNHKKVKSLITDLLSSSANDM